MAYYGKTGRELNLNALDSTKFPSSGSGVECSLSSGYGTGWFSGSTEIKGRIAVAPTITMTFIKNASSSQANVTAKIKNTGNPSGTMYYKFSNQSSYTSAIATAGGAVTATSTYNLTGSSSQTASVQAYFDSSAVMDASSVIYESVNIGR